MPAVKRKSVGESLDAPSAKLPRMSATELQFLDKTELIRKMLALQEEVDRAPRPATAGQAELSDETIKEKTDHARSLMVKGIKNKMTACGCVVRGSTCGLDIVLNLSSGRPAARTDLHASATPESLLHLQSS